MPIAPVVVAALLDKRRGNIPYTWRICACGNELSSEDGWSEKPQDSVFMYSL